MIEGVPDLKRWHRVLLAIASGVLLGLSFPPFHLGVLAAAGLVPLLVSLQGLSGIRAPLRYVYLAMVVFHAITINWTGGYAHGNDPYMMIAGSVTILIHPFFYYLPMGVYLLVRRHLGENRALFFLPFLWVGYEYSHALSEWSFPWLTLGNSQTYDLARIQFIEYTGVWGLSFWIVTLNVLVFMLLFRIITDVRNSWRRSTKILAGASLVLAFAPLVHGLILLSSAGDGVVQATDAQGMNIGIVQSNVDPWDKWKANGFETHALYMDLTKRLVDSVGAPKPDIVLWPETAAPLDILGPQNAPVLLSLRDHLSSWQTGLLTGLPHKTMYPDSATAPRSARKDKVSGARYDWFNAATFIGSGKQTPQWYGKMKMVPFAERVPYADVFQAFDFLRWDVGIGGWQIGPDTTVFHDERTGARFSTIICYESTYPGFVAEFVRRGAEFMTLITIDSWWDHMSGAYQHQQIAVLRAVENRRWIARCAVGGISSYIDPFGRAHGSTELFTQRLLSSRIRRNTDMTFYTQHGDLLGELCLWLSAVVFAAGLGQAFLTRRRSLAWQQQ
jgi:apolipoprotein N-acyltransferase